jgi:hypothetical protein
MPETDRRVPRSTDSHCGSHHSLDHREKRSPSQAKQAAVSGASFDEAVNIHLAPLTLIRGDATRISGFNVDDIVDPSRSVALARK